MKLYKENHPIRSDYTYTIEGNIIVIVDLDKGNRSVTNDIDNVLADIKQELGDDLAGYSIIYRDSMGIWDAISLSPNGFANFYSLNERDKEKAMNCLLPVII